LLLLGGAFGIVKSASQFPVSIGTSIALPVGTVQLSSAFPLKRFAKNHTCPLWLMVHLEGVQ